VPWIIGDEQTAMQMSADLREAGFLIPAIRYPTVARGTARLRVTLSAEHTEEQVGKLLTAFGHTGRRGVSG
jgi:7-keto-8-aminopelargonate synthetase-like enzyme